ncbi:MAG: FKBP-type peptidyl-prolyl cis-trans isomerase [Rikenellaceae bacterium]|nr:FKBP-type peptidyl-prolyl cis-trans isomerase [Rikenellaceae bacterium]
MSIKRNIWGAIALALLALAGCNKMDEEITKQESNFERYLSNQGAADRDKYDPETDMSGKTKFYDRIGGVYRWNPKEFNLMIERPTGDSVTVAKGDSLSIYYHAYVMEGSRPGDLFDTNRKYLINSKFKNLNTELWSTDPLRFKLGDGTLMPSLEQALPGCVLGDSVIFLLTCDLAYGKKPIGVVPQYSPIMFTIIIDDIIKK